MMLRKWELFAIAVDADDELCVDLAARFNAQPERFLFRRSAVSASRFFESRMYLPLLFYVVKRN